MKLIYCIKLSSNYLISLWWKEIEKMMGFVINYRLYLDRCWGKVTQCERNKFKALPLIFECTLSQVSEIFNFKLFYIKIFLCVWEKASRLISIFRLITMFLMTLYFLPYSSTTIVLLLLLNLLLPHILN